MKSFWTDGSAVPNPGDGGYAVIDGETRKPVALGRGENTTNIRMEGRAIIAAMRLAKGEACEIYTDSQFWINVLTKWVASWEKKGWKRGPLGDEEIQNIDLVTEAWKLYQEGDFQLVWVRGHVGMRLNEKADLWADRARRGKSPDGIEIVETI